MQNKHTILLTGASGYVGGMLADQFSRRDDVGRIIAMDRREKPALLANNKKIFWITANTSDDNWEDKVRSYNPNVVIHCAWQIREMYGKKVEQWKWNVVGSRNVFDFAFNTPSVRKLIYFSTASSYGAFPDNTLEHYYKENELQREDTYLYGIEKKQAEIELKKAYAKAKQEGKNVPQVSVVRPAAITGPRGRILIKRFGLQSVLQKGLPIIPIANNIWCRQFIHEDDVTDIIAFLAFGETNHKFEIFNITPNSVVLASDMAEIMNKKTLRITPGVVRVVFFVLWHLSLGKIPTSKGGWKFYSYPIVMDGSKIFERYGFKYEYKSREALEKVAGRYADEAIRFLEESGSKKGMSGDAKKKVIVTGGAGFIGSNLTDALIEKGYEVHVIDNLCNGKREYVNKKAIFHRVDITNYYNLLNTFKKIGNIYCVFHEASLPRVQFSLAKQRRTTEANIMGTVHVLLSSKNVGARRVVYAGSSSAYGDQTEMPLREDMAPNPKSPYAIQKLTGEYYCRVFSEFYKIETASLRYFNVYGPRQNLDGDYALVLGKFMTQKGNGKPLTITGDGNQTRAFTYVGDVVRANLLAMESEKIGIGEVINVGSNVEVPINKLAKIVGGSVIHISPRVEPRRTCADVSRAKELLGWEPLVQIEEGLRKVEDSYSN